MMDRPKATQNVQPGTNGLRHIFFDFDGTITTNDTIGLVAQAVLQWRRETCDEDLTRRVSASWQRIQDAYAQDMNNYESSQPPKAQRTTREAEIDHLRGRREIEAASLRRVNESGMFHGFGMHQLFQAGVRDREAGRLFLRDGFEQFIRSLKEADPTCMIHVLSVNWSASYIRGVLEPMCDFIYTVIANEIQVDGTISAIPGALPELTPRALMTSEDKLRAARHVLGRLGGNLMQYYGDSTTDLECLLASVQGGIVTSDGTGSLMETLQRIRGRPVPHLSQLTEDSEEQVFWIKDFTNTQRQQVES